MRTRVVGTCLGPVEVALTPGEGEVVLFFPGGHAPAATPLCADLYTGLGYRVLVFSRPGYGGTNVGPLTAAEFTPAIARVCERLGLAAAAATVGLSFGGLQAVHVAVSLRRFAPRLILHSCAPSVARYSASHAASRYRPTRPRAARPAPQQIGQQEHGNTGTALAATCRPRACAPPPTARPLARA